MVIPEQDRDSPLAVHLTFHQQGMGLTKEIRVMLEVLGEGLDGVHHVISTKCLTMKARHANQKSFH